MLSKETKKKIDDARDILVGQLPLPSDQVELITIALIYKFMDDQDEDLRQLNFGEVFFTGDLKEYSWQRLMSNEIDAEARVNKFTKGIEEIQKAAHIPLLFREIFKNTFLKFRDGRILFLFLGVINGFSYDHSEELGNAFEYLLMSMGAQGENGQFRTPRNIIDFIVEVVDPDKGHTILDPACGTGGFLLSAYKHILRKHTTGCEHYRITLSNEEIEGIPVNWGDKLTSQDMLQLGTSIEGYDITPLMVRLARVNLFLHQFKSPRIHEYDTLTSDGRWKDKYDCILANPPFMTPKGGVTTHSRFRIRATKAEVLFSDYILEHLTPDGMAGFIVPEGIIFQNSGDYVELRKWLVTGAGLWAVVSLPAQIFQPYSGVKTSILFIDRNVARSREEIILVKVENDGYSLNANRGPVSKNDLPEALNLLTIGKKSLSELREYLEKNSGKPNMPQVLIKPRKEFAKLDAYKAQSSAFNLIRKQFEKCQTQEKELKELPVPDSDGGKKRVRLQTAFTKQTGDFFKVAGVKYERLATSLQSFFEDNLKEAVIAYGADSAQTGGLPAKLREHLEGERGYNLSGEIVRESQTQHMKWPMATLGEVAKYVNGFPFKPGDWHNDGKEIIRIQNLTGTGKNINRTLRADIPLQYLVQRGDLLISWSATIGFYIWDGEEAYLNQHIFRVAPEPLIEKSYLFCLGNKISKEIQASVHGNTMQHITKGRFESIQIPLPPLEIQKQIVTEIEAYQKVIDGCKLIIENYRTDLNVDTNWPVVELGSIADLKNGLNYSADDSGSTIKILGVSNFKNHVVAPIDELVEIQINGRLDNSYLLQEGDILFVRSNGNQELVGRSVIVPAISEPITFSGFTIRCRFTAEVVPKFYAFLFKSAIHASLMKETGRGANIRNLSQGLLKEIKIPLPPLETQQKIVAELEQDLAAVAGAKRLKAKMAANIRAIIGRVWGEKA